MAAKRPVTEPRNNVPMDGSTNVLPGLVRRSGPTLELVDIGPHQLVNVTFRVDVVALTHARCRALLEGTSVNALVCRLLEDYSGIQPPPGEEIPRRLPRYRRQRDRTNDAGEVG